ncbi:CopG family transcriptional regulator [Natrialba swarupiae]|nr:CopG family transcriptional regulator [Natrialba swarupiae]
MAKDTVRYPDEVVEEIDALVDDGMFESKSEFYRFSAEYVLSLINPEHDVKTFNFDEIKTELDISESDHARALGTDGGTFFRRRDHRPETGITGNYEAAERFIDTHYDATDQECIILEELLGTYRERPE